MKRCLLNDYPWEQIEATKQFITSLYTNPKPERPGILMHPEPKAGVVPSPHPGGLNAFQRQVWNAVDQIRRRPVGIDDFVPAIGTGAGTSALATAFGCAEAERKGVLWVKPAVTRIGDIDHIRKPRITDGRLGGVLEQTRAVADYADERIAVRVMDFQSPFTTVEQILGTDLFFTIPYDAPGKLHALMDVVTDFAIEFFQAQRAAAGPNGCPGIWPSFWFPRCAGIQMSDDHLVNVSPETYAEFVVPYNNRIAQAFGGMFLHSCTIRETHILALRMIRPLTGINCDISTSVTTGRLLREFGDHAVVAPHAYINTNTNFQSYGEFMDAVLAEWVPGKRLFIHPCSVMYIPSLAREIRFHEAEVRAALTRKMGRPW